MEPKAEGAKKTGEEFRLRMQLEITLLVWVRTSLALMGFGFVVARFGLFLREIARATEIKVRARPQLAAVSSMTGTVLILLGVFTMLVAVVNHLNWVKRLERGELDLPSRWSVGVFLSLALAALGMVLAGYLGMMEF